MATEIAHEQNQPLAAIHALTDNARTMLKKEMYPQVEQNLKHIISVIERMTQLISNLKHLPRAIAYLKVLPMSSK